MPHRPSTRRGVTLAVAIACTPLAVASSAPSTWLATWQASPQRVWSTDFLFPTHLPAVLRDQTVRQVARVSVGGSRLRIVVSNAYGEVPVRIGAVTVARPGADGAIIPGSLREVTFGGTTGATLLPRASLVSDPVALPIPARAQLAVSVYLPNATPMTTFHWDGRQTGWIVPGNQTSAPALSGKAGAEVATTARPLLSGIHVEANDAAKAVAVIGDSITDGATASMDADHRWPDFLAARLVPRGAAVVNAGMSGARLLSDGMGANALARLDRDVLAQPGVRSVIVLLGINDVACPGTAFAPGATRPTLDDLVSGSPVHCPGSSARRARDRYDAYPVRGRLAWHPACGLLRPGKRTASPGGERVDTHQRCVRCGARCRQGAAGYRSSVAARGSRRATTPGTTCIRATTATARSPRRWTSTRCSIRRRTSGPLEAQHPERPRMLTAVRRMMHAIVDGDLVEVEGAQAVEAGNVDAVLVRV